MVSKVEILEFVLKNGPIKCTELRKVFGGSTINKTVFNLTKNGLLKRFIIRYDENEGYKKIYLKPSELKRGKMRTYVEISEKAIEYLKRHNATSFFDTPMAHICRALMKRDFIKF